MKNQLNHLSISNYTTQSGVNFKELPLTYQLFGKPLQTAPIVLVNHALTGNSNVTGKQGWWQHLIGENKIIDLNKFTLLAFNIPGNGYDGFFIENYKDFVTKDVANIFLEGLQQLKITKLFAIIGGSLGGGIAWEMATIQPNITKNLIPIAADYKATDWLMANCLVQEQILINSKKPLQDARLHAMLCYRTPQSLKNRFNRSINTDLGVFNVESWLLHHGKKLQQRFQLAAYKLMNQLLKTIDVNHEKLATINANILMIGVDTDLFFTPEENKETLIKLAKTEAKVAYKEIKSIHGHDAFLIEFEQLNTILRPIFELRETTQLFKMVSNG